MSEINILGTIRKIGDEYCLFFSDGRKECFPSKGQAEKREKQVQFFKHKNTKGSAERNYALANLGVLAEYSPESSNEHIYVIGEEDSYKLVICKEKDSEEDLEIFILDKEYPDYNKYKDLVAYALTEASTETKTQTIKLSEAFIEGQIIGGSHTHKVDLEGSMGWTTEDFGHKHFVEYGPGMNSPYVSSAPIEINGIRISHSHFILIDLKD